MKNSNKNDVNNAGVHQDYEIWVLLNRARRIISRSLQLELSQYNLPPEYGSVLYILISKGGSATLQEIADIKLMQYNSVTTEINKMLGTGLIKKEKPDKRRRYIVTITDEGREAFGRISMKSLEMVFGVLSSEERKQLDASLKKIVIRGRKMLGLDYIPPFLI
jgi:DNA-binding MarR family transcriptional regulator